ncbi:MAG: hypothetical protein OXI54_08020 [Chloroflexota bacterium]|nr:hypothetical protein [Chloroflexota bacterium]MDE2684080.1 hypothetical protein [Chloroflexota bacterium]
MAGDADDRDIALDQVLEAVADAHPDRLAGWIRDEPGHWGFFAGQAVLTVRELIGRRLEEPERRFVWHRMWLVLLERRREAGD